MKARYTPRFGKRFSHLEEGEATVEGMGGKVKIMVQNSKGNQFWVFLDPVDLLDAALGALPLGRLENIPKDIVAGMKKLLTFQSGFEERKGD